MMTAITLEVIAVNADDARAAQAGGAGRIELVADLAVGGVTPDVNVIRAVKQAVSIPVYVMIRPRGGGFVYDDREVATMVEQARMAVQAGADGLVLGALRESAPDRLVPRVPPEDALEIDLEAVIRIVGAAQVPVAFHRAFDELEPEGMQRALEQLSMITFVERVLTSGGASNVEEGIDMLAELVAFSEAIGGEGWQRGAQVADTVERRDAAISDTMGRGGAAISDTIGRQDAAVGETGGDDDPSELRSGDVSGSRGTRRPSESGVGGLNRARGGLDTAYSNPDRPLSIMPGGGVTLANAAHIVATTGVREIHVGTGVRKPATPEGSVSEALVRKLRASLSA